MVTVPAPVPVPGECHSQVASWLMPQRSALPPVLLMVKVWAGGLLLPCCAVKDRLGGVMPMAGGTGAAVTVKETGIVTGVAVVPLGQTVTRPLWVPMGREPVMTLMATVPVPVALPEVCASQVAS